MLTTVEQGFYDRLRAKFPDAKPRSWRRDARRLGKGLEPYLGQGRPAREESTFDNGWWSITIKAKAAKAKKSIFDFE